MSIHCAEDQCRAALFLNRRGGRLSARAVNQLLDDLAADADLEDAVSKLPADQ
jgi:site-specific recombinase XerD